MPVSAAGWPSPGSHAGMLQAGSVLAELGCWQRGQEGAHCPGWRPGVLLGPSARRCFPHPFLTARSPLGSISDPLVTLQDTGLGEKLHVGVNRSRTRFCHHHDEVPTPSNFLHVPCSQMYHIQDTNLNDVGRNSLVPVFYCSAESSTQGPAFFGCLLFL